MTDEGSIADYFNSVWNRFDACGLTLGIVWFILRVDVTCDSPKFEVCHTFLAAASIFYCFSILNYVSTMNDFFGKMVILVFDMAWDLCAFFSVWLAFFIGVVVFFYSLYRDIPLFSTPTLVFLTLFAANLNNYDPTFENYDVAPMSDVAIWVETIFVAFFSVVLMNLVIARLNFTYSDVSDHADQEWQFRMAETVKSFLLFRETNPLRMLPAPLNLVPTLLSPFHITYIWIKKNAFLRCLEEMHDHFLDENGNFKKFDVFASIAG